MNKECKILIFIFLVALLIRVIFLFSYPTKWWDETVYANLGYDLSQNPFHYSYDGKWSDFVPDNLWPKAGFRAPLLPVLFALIYFVKMDFLIELLMPIIGALSCVLIYLIGKKLFNKEIATYSAILLAVSYFHIYYSSKILTDGLSVFFILLSVLVFIKGYEEKNNKYKILFGVVLALSLLTRYTALWTIPIFFIYLIIRDRNLKLLKDKYFWLSILVFLVVISPWLIYSYSAYGNIFGALMHGNTAVNYWGGSQPWNFYITNFFETFHIVGIISLVAILYIIYKKEFLKKEIFFILIWLIFLFVLTSTIVHKEPRYILSIFPAMCLLSGFLIEKIKKYKYLIFAIIIAWMLIYYSVNFSKEYRKSYTDTNDCFLQGNNFLKTLDKNILVITDESPLVYYYTKRETGFYPGPWSISKLNNLVQSKGKKTYIFFTDFDMPMWREDIIKIKQDLDSNYKEVFNCKNKTYIYEV